MSSHRDVFVTIRSEGALLPPDFLKRITEGAKDVPGLTPESYHLPPKEKLNEAITRSWNRLLGFWAAFQAASSGLKEDDPAIGLTRDKWLLPLFQELGYGRLPTGKGFEIEGKSYPISHVWQNAPIHLLGRGVDLDRPTKGVAGAARHSPHGLVQEFLNRHEGHLWGFLSNGLKLRILRDNKSLTRQAYVEFDLGGMMDGQVYSDFALLWLVCHQSRVEAERAEQCWLEKWTEAARQQGTRALEDLRDGVQKAIEALGRGFLAHAANRELLEKLRKGTLDKQDYYRQLLRTVYRLIFLFVAEDRDLLFMPQSEPKERERYRRHYSAQRLRTLAEKRRGSPHPDLWQALRLVFAKLSSDTGCKELGLPALGSFLWSDKATPDLDKGELANTDLLLAVRSLAFTVDRKVRRSIDYRNLGAEELGSVYESLLELHPDVNADAPTFDLKVAAGHERKTTGSYYTPTSLIECLLDSALEPVLQEAAKQPDPEKAILDLKVCDPACGSGHFLLAAGRRMAKRLAAVRSGDQEPSPEAGRNAFRDIVGRCLYGVDVNVMAVELCKVSLWLEALQPGKPLSFLEHHVRQGDSLVGVTPRLVAAGIPDAAFSPMGGDDRRLAAALRKRNSKEREGQIALFGSFVTEVDEAHARVSVKALELEGLGDETIAELHAREIAFSTLQSSADHQLERKVSDAWCAAFACPKVKGDFEVPTQELISRLAQSAIVPAATLAVIESLRKEYSFFHFHVAYPGVFGVREPGNGDDPSDPGWTGGFDVVLGNPPWEKLTVSEEEWFATRQPTIGETKGKARRGALISGLEKEDPTLLAQYRNAQRRAQALSNLLSKEAGSYPLSGTGELNTYHLFAELAVRLVKPSGRVGLIVKTGIGSAVNCLPLFRRLTERHELVSMFDFVNTKGLFPTVQTVERFSLLTFTGAAGHQAPIRFATLLQEPADLGRPGREYTLSPEDIQLMSPENGACPLLRGALDAEIMRSLYRRFPTLGDRIPDEVQRRWNVEYTRIFDMAIDSKDFKRLEELSSDGVRVLAGRSVRIAGTEYWPLYEGKYIYLLEHRYGSFETVPTSKRYGRKASAPAPTLSQLQDPAYEIQPRYWFPRQLWLERARARSLRTDYHFLFRDVAGVYPDRRTAIGALCPAGPAGDKAPVLTLPSTGDEMLDTMRYLVFAGLFCSIPFDYIVRNKLYSKSLKFNVLGQIPMPVPEEVVPAQVGSSSLGSALASAVLSLSYVTWSLQPLGEALGVEEPLPYDRDARFLLMRRIDALAAHFYRLSRGEFAHILETFESIEREETAAYGEFRTKSVALEEFDRIQDNDPTGGGHETPASKRGRVE